MDKTTAIGIAVCVGVLGWSGTAAAQATDKDAPTAPVSRPFRGLFGGGSKAVYGHTLDLRADVYNEFGNDPSDPLVAGADVLPRSEWFSGLRANVAYETRRQFSEAAIQAEATTRYYRDPRIWTALRVRTTAVAETSLGLRRRTSLRLAGTFERDPYYTLPLIAAGVPVVGASVLPTSRDDVLARQDRYVTSGDASIERAIGRRNAVVLESSIRNVSAREAGFNTRDWRLGGHYNRRTSQYLSLRLGYSYQHAEYGIDRSGVLIGHTIDAGVDYRRPLTRSRKTTFGFGTGSSLVEFDSIREYRFTGFANLRHELNRGWFLEAQYDRSVRPVEGFAQPFFYDTATGSVGGLVGRRVELFASGGYSTGDIGVTGGTFKLLQGSARVRFALASYLALDVEGLMFRYELPETVDVALALRPAYDRRSLRTNLTFWLPVL